MSAAFLTWTALASLLLVEAGVRLLRPQQLNYDVFIYQPDEKIGWRHQTDLRVEARRAGRTIAICIDARGDRVRCVAAVAAFCEGAPRRARGDAEEVAELDQSQP